MKKKIYKKGNFYYEYISSSSRSALSTISNYSVVSVIFQCTGSYCCRFLSVICQTNLNCTSYFPDVIPSHDRRSSFHVFRISQYYSSRQFTVFPSCYVSHPCHFSEYIQPTNKSIIRVFQHNTFHLGDLEFCCCFSSLQCPSFAFICQYRYYAM